MVVYTMGIQPCVAGGLAGKRQYYSKMDTSAWAGFVQILQKSWFYRVKKRENWDFELSPHQILSESNYEIN